MKKSSPTGARISPGKKSAPSRAIPARKADRSNASDPRNCTRLELAPSRALALLEPPTPPFGAALRRVRFGYFKPEAREVHVVGSFNGWDLRGTPLSRDGLGDWSVEVDLPPGEHRYRLFVDGEWRDDPSAQQTVPNPFGGFDAIMTVV